MLLGLPAELFELTLRFAHETDLPAARVACRRWLHAVGREYRRRALIQVPELEMALQLGLLVGSWYRFHRALTAPNRGVQAGRRLDMRGLLAGDALYSYLGKERALQDFTLFVCVESPKQNIVLSRTLDQFDGALRSIPLFDGCARYIVKHTEPHACGWNCKCGSIWREMEDTSCKFTEIGFSISTYHRRLGFARWVIGGRTIGCMRSISSEADGILVEHLPEEGQEWWKLPKLQRAIDRGDTLRFTTTEDVDNPFGDNIDSISTAYSHGMGEAFESGTHTAMQASFIARRRGELWEVSAETLGVGINPGPYASLELVADWTDTERREWYARVRDYGVGLPHLLASQLSWLPD